MNCGTWKEVMRQMGVGIFHVLTMAKDTYDKTPWYHIKARWQLQGMISGLSSVGQMFKQTWTALDLEEKISESKDTTNGDGKA